VKGGLGAAAVMAIAATPAFAGIMLPIGGAYGDATGCALYFTGDRSAPDLAVLTPYTFMTEDHACTFEELIRIDGDALRVKARCGRIGEKAIPYAISVTGNETAGYAVESSGGWWGPLFLCPGTETLFKPLRISV